MSKTSLVSSEVKVMCHSGVCLVLDPIRNNGRKLNGCGSHNYLYQQPQIHQCVLPYNGKNVFVGSVISVGGDEC